MTLELLDWNDEITEFDIGDRNDIAMISIKVVTGDEIATVIYKNYTVAEFDSGVGRMQDYYDGEYVIYRFDEDNNLIDSDKFKNRKTSYDFQHFDIDEPSQ